MISLKIGSHGFFVIALLLVVTSVMQTGCASLGAKGLLPEVTARQLPQVNVGAELILLDEAPKLATSLITSDGKAHVFAIDKGKHLHHVEIAGDDVLAHEVLGVIDTTKRDLDAIEQPPGNIRVLAGDKQFIRNAPGATWLETEGNRCSRFLKIDDGLYCAFVIKGEEIGAPRRTDKTFGLFILAPVFYWHHTQASKLVVAEESPEGWAIRSVLDPGTLDDADQDFVAGVDNLGTVHFLYRTSRGGGQFAVVASPGGIAGGFLGHPAELRYAEVSRDQLRSQHKERQDRSLAEAPSWLSIEGVSLPSPSFLETPNDVRKDLRPLHRNFAVNKASGEMNGLMLVREATLIQGSRKLFFNRDSHDHAWVDVRIGNGEWDYDSVIVTAKDLPTATSYWGNAKINIEKDSRGNTHLLMTGDFFGGWMPGHDPTMYYLLKDGTGWSAPLLLGRMNWGSASTLAVNGTGFGFASWLSEKSTFIGRWILPRNREEITGH